MENKNYIKGYKVFNPDWTCREFQYEVGKTYEENITPETCSRAFIFVNVHLIVLIITALARKIKLRK